MLHYSEVSLTQYTSPGGAPLWTNYKALATFRGIVLLYPLTFHFFCIYVCLLSYPYFQPVCNVYESQNSIFERLNPNMSDFRSIPAI